MSLQTVTRAAESDLQPGQVYEVLADASNIPKWAPVFADTIEGVSDSHHRVNKNGEDFDLEILVHRSAGTVDYIRDMPNGNRGGAYIRVTPHPRAGSVVTMTMPVGPDTNESDVARTVDQELANLIRIASS